MTHNKLNYLEKLHANRYRLTRQRQAVRDAICQAEGHAASGEIYCRASSTRQVTGSNLAGQPPWLPPRARTLFN
jgi:Fe2+ or Zn2+ uptake regulation protein